MKFGTKTIHAGISPDPTTGAIMTPIYQTSTYVQQSPGKHKGYEYSRTQNPTRFALENNLAALENGKEGMVFSSGLAATDAIVKMFNPGDEILSCNDLYGGTYRAFEKVFRKYGLDFVYDSMQDTKKLEKLISYKTKLIWLETPSNPMMSVIDIEAIAKIAKAKGVLLCVDNTFASPYLQNPLDLGADMVIHSGTKYIGGHSDVVIGAVVVNEATIIEQLRFIQNASGAVPGPQDAFLTLRGIKTLHLRMQRHCENAMKIAQYLSEHPKVSKVNYPGLPDHPGHAIAKKQMRGFGGMLSFSLKINTQEAAYDFLTRTKLFSLAESLGGVESLAGHPATMTHAAIPLEEREKTGVLDSLIRISVGIEDADDLLEDIEQALA
ncbi:MAG: cystathionine gamma-synthase [Chitinophagales bacterium]